MIEMWFMLIPMSLGIFVAKMFVSSLYGYTSIEEPRKNLRKSQIQNHLEKEIRELEKEKLEVEVDLLEAKTELLELTLPESRLVTQCMICGHETKDKDHCEQCGASWLVNSKYASTSSTGT